MYSLVTARSQKEKPEDTRGTVWKSVKKGRFFSKILFIEHITSRYKMPGKAVASTQIPAPKTKRFVHLPHLRSPLPRNTRAAPPSIPTLPQARRPQAQARRGGGHREPGREKGPRRQSSVFKSTVKCLAAPRNKSGQGNRKNALRLLGKQRKPF